MSNRSEDICKYIIDHRDSRGDGNWVILAIQEDYSDLLEEYINSGYREAIISQLMGNCKNKDVLYFLFHRTSIPAEELAERVIVNRCRNPVFINELLSRYHDINFIGYCISLDNTDIAHHMLSNRILCLREIQDLAIAYNADEVYKYTNNLMNKIALTKKELGIAFLVCFLFVIMILANVQF
jgi:hypothetical protein